MYARYALGRLLGLVPTFLAIVTAAFFLMRAAPGGPFDQEQALPPEIRANLPRYSNWPTFPQLFINGELIGGCDITLELYESGELARMVKEVRKA